LLLVSIFYLNYLSRMVIAPLLPVIEIEFGLGHGQAGSLFLFLATGVCAGLFGSSFVSSRVNYRRTVIFSAVALGGAMLATSQSASLMSMRSGLLLVGISAGLYFPSGIAVLTDVVSKEHWGKAMAMHELAPNLALVTAPLMVEALLKFLPWRGIIGILGGSLILMGAIYFRFGRGGAQKGDHPHPKAMQKMLGEPCFWIMAAVFVFSIGACDGVYAMLPLFLVNEVGFDRELANTIVGLSHVSGVVLLLFSGLITDRIGPKRATILFLTTTGVLTILLGILHGPLVSPTLVFLQTTSTACFFPPALAIVSLIFSPSLRSLGISLVLIVGIFFGAGTIPPGIGYIAEASSFSVGFCILGMFVLAVVVLLFYLRANSHADE
jgi:NNP family nitrate/nitrite transporter-like MFS transporter